ncbi:hypothetical protein JCM10213v2_005837 [Rhodosporidiobolus nylandii]
MAQPRRRQQSTLSAWPTLSLLAIYSNEPLLTPAERETRLDDATVEAAKLLFVLAPDEDGMLSKERQGRLMGTVMGVAGFTRYTIALPRPSRHSRAASAATVSSAASGGDARTEGLDNDVLLAALRQAYREYRLQRGSFAGMLAREGKEVLKEQMDGFWREWAFKWDLAGGRGRASIERVLDAVPRCSLLSVQTSTQLQPLLSQFAASHPSVLPFLLHSTTVVSLPILRSRPPASDRDPDTTPTKAKKPAPPPLTEDDVLALVRLLASLAPRHASLSVDHDLPATPLPPSHPPAEFSASASSAAGEVGSKWSTPFSTLTSGMSSLLLAPRPLANVSMPSLPHMPLIPSMPSFGGGSSPVAGKPDLRAGFKALRSQEQAAMVQRRAEDNERVALGRGTPPYRPDSGGRWSLRGVSWATLGFGSDSALPSLPEGAAGKAPAALAPSAAEAVAEPSAGTTAGAAETAVEEAAASLVLPTEPGTVEPTHEEEAPEPPLSPSQPSTPAVELAPAVDVDELAEAIGASPQAVAVALPPTPPAKDDRSVKGAAEEEASVEADGEQRVFELFCGRHGEREERFCLRRYTRGPLTLALAHLPFPVSHESEVSLSWLDTRAERLLEAVETVLEVVDPPKPAYPHRHFVKHGAMVSTFAPTLDPSAVAEEAEASLALLESFRSLNTSPPILESVTRLASSQWAVHRRSFDSSSPFSSSSAPSSTATNSTDVYAILPARTGKGKEASLLDAAEELRRVSRAYYTVS